MSVKNPEIDIDWLIDWLIEGDYNDDIDDQDVDDLFIAGSDKSKRQQTKGKLF